MLRKRPLLAFVAVLLFVVPLLNCGSAHSADELYVLVSANIQVPYWKAAGAGLAQAAGQLGVRYEFVGPDEYDPNAEKAAFDKALTKKPTGILVSAADAKLLTENIDKAIAAGIPVITIDSDAPESKRLFFPLRVGESCPDQDRARRGHRGRSSHRLRYHDTNSREGTRQGGCVRVPGGAGRQGSRDRA